MKTFEEAISKIQGDGSYENFKKFQANLLCEFDNLRADPNFQHLIRVTLDETVMRMINDQSPTLAITQALIATAQTFLLIGMEMEKE